MDLIIVASQPIDDSPKTLKCIRRKVQTYLTVVELAEFQAEMGHPPLDKTAIILLCEHLIHAKALAVIAQCRVTAAAQGVRLEVRKSPDSAPIPLPEGGNELVESIRPATRADRSRISAQVASVLGLLRSRYGDVQLRQTRTTFACSSGCRTTVHCGPARRMIWRRSAQCSARFSRLNPAPVGYGRVAGGADAEFALPEHHRHRLPRFDDRQASQPRRAGEVQVALSLDGSPGRTIEG